MAIRLIVVIPLLLVAPHLAFAQFFPAEVLPGPVTTNETETVFAVDIASDNLISVFEFNNTTKVWSFFNPDFIAAGANTYNTTSTGDIVWIRLEADVTFQGAALTEGWNLVVLD